MRRTSPNCASACPGESNWAVRFLEKRKWNKASAPTLPGVSDPGRSRECHERLLPDFPCDRFQVQNSKGSQIQAGLGKISGFQSAKPNSLSPRAVRRPPAAECCGAGCPVAARCKPDGCLRAPAISECGKRDTRR